MSSRRYLLASVFNSRSRSSAKITGVTMRMCRRLLNMPPMTGVASGCITSLPGRWLHMMGSRPATMRTRPAPPTMRRTVGEPRSRGFAPDRGPSVPLVPVSSVVRLRAAVCLLGRFPALAGLDLDLDAGGVVLLSGPNGAGKTTLLRLLAGLLPLHSGEGTVLGTDLAVDRRTHRRRLALRHLGKRQRTCGGRGGGGRNRGRFGHGLPRARREHQQ